MPFNGRILQSRPILTPLDETDSLSEASKKW